MVENMMDKLLTILICKVLNIECYGVCQVYCLLYTRYSSLDNEVVNNLWDKFMIE